MVTYWVILIPIDYHHNRDQLGQIHAALVEISSQIVFKHTAGISLYLFFTINIIVGVLALVVYVLSLIGFFFSFFMWLSYLCIIQNIIFFCQRYNFLDLSFCKCIPLKNGLLQFARCFLEKKDWDWHVVTVSLYTVFLIVAT